jgi:hypothetical protein
MTGSFELRGVKELNAAIRGRIEADTVEALERHLTELAESIMAKAKDLVPIDTGTLMNSGHVKAPITDRRAVSVTMGFGGPASDYAIAVHEIPPDRAEHEPPRQWKYLETPVLAAAKALAEATGAAVTETAREVRPSQGAR